MPFGGITDDEMRTMAEELAARVADKGDPFNGDDWALFQLAKAVPALMDATADLIAACEMAEVSMDTAAMNGVGEILPPEYRGSWARAHRALQAAIAKAKGGAE